MTFDDATTLMREMTDAGLTTVSLSRLGDIWRLSALADPAHPEGRLLGAYSRKLDVPLHSMTIIHPNLNAKLDLLRSLIPGGQ